MRRLVLSIATLSVCISGCTIMSALESAGEEFSQGKVLSGVWTGTMGVFLGAVTDVVTVGGTLEVDEATQMWSDVLTVTSQQGQPGSLNTYQMQNMQRLLTKSDPISPHSSATSHGNSSKSNIAASDTEIALNSQLLHGASCKGDMAFLAPHLPAYTAVEVNTIRSLILSSSVSESISTVKQHTSNKQQAFEALLGQAQSHNQAAAEAATTANQTDGYGNSVSIDKVNSNTLNLDFSCEGIHHGAVCVAGKAPTDHLWS